MKILYFDCYAGISGDMTLGALLDLGLDKEEFLNKIQLLNIDDFDIKISKANKNGISGTDVDVIIKNAHHHEHRNLTNIEEMIDKSELNDHIKELSKNIFKKVAIAEASVHGKTINEVHFHEVGAMDSIVDIVGVAILIDMLNVDKVISSPLHCGTGFVKCQHGKIPVPAPATVEIFKNCSIPTYSKGIKGELVTPTGAAIIGEIAKEYSSIPETTISQIGYGAGKKDFEFPNYLRVYVGETK